MFNSALSIENYTKYFVVR